MTISISNQGAARGLTRLLATDCILRLFKSDTTQVAGTLIGAFEWATFTGYSPITLTGGSWTIANGLATKTQQTFSSSADQTAQVIYGWAITDAELAVLFAERFPSPKTVQLSTDRIYVNPRITYAAAA